MRDQKNPNESNSGPSSIPSERRMRRRSDHDRSKAAAPVWGWDRATSIPMKWIERATEIPLK